MPHITKGSVFKDKAGGKIRFAGFTDRSKETAVVELVGETKKDGSPKTKEVKFEKLKDENHFKLVKRAEPGADKAEKPAKTVAKNGKAEKPAKAEKVEKAAKPKKAAKVEKAAPAPAEEPASAPAGSDDDEDAVPAKVGHDEEE